MDTITPNFTGMKSKAQRSSPKATKFFEKQSWDLNPSLCPKHMLTPLYHIAENEEHIKGSAKFRKTHMGDEVKNGVCCPRMSTVGFKTTCHWIRVVYLSLNHVRYLPLRFCKTAGLATLYCTHSVAAGPWLALGMGRPRSTVGGRHPQATAAVTTLH